MKLKDLLKKAGLTEEQANTVVTKTEDENLKVLIDDGGEDGKTPQYIPKTRLDDEIEKKKLLQGQLTNATKSITDLEKSLKGNDDVEKTIKDLKETNEALNNKYITSVKQSAVRLVAIRENAKDPEDVLKYTDLAKVSINENGEAVGAEELVKSLKEKKEYFFNDAKGTGGTGDPGNPGGKPGKGGGESVGKQLADYSKQAVTDSHKARDDFFK